MSYGVASFLYFAYGRHLDQATLQDLCPGAELLGLGKLESYGLVLASHGGLTVVPAPGDSVRGAIWLVPATFLPAMDQFHRVAEGDYVQASRRVLTPAGPRVELTLYFTPHPGPPPSKPDLARLRTISDAARRLGLTPGAAARIERCGRVA